MFDWYCENREIQLLLLTFPLICCWYLVIAFECLIGFMRIMKVNYLLLFLICCWYWVKAFGCLIYEDHEIQLLCVFILLIRLWYWVIAFGCSIDPWEQWDSIPLCISPFILICWWCWVSTCLVFDWCMWTVRFSFILCNSFWVFIDSCKPWDLIPSHISPFNLLVMLI